MWGKKNSIGLQPDRNPVFHLGQVLLWFVWVLFLFFTRCWDIIENTDVSWWIIKTPILASILVSLQALSTFWSLKLYYINMYAPWAVDTLKSGFSGAKLIARERENVSYDQSTLDLSVSVIHVKGFKLHLLLSIALYVNTAETLIRAPISCLTLESLQDNHQCFVFSDRSSSSSSSSSILSFHFILSTVLASTETSVNRCIQRFKWGTTPCNYFLFM